MPAKSKHKTNHVSITITKELKKTLHEYKEQPNENYTQLINRLIKEVEVLQNELDKHN